MKFNLPNPISNNLFYIVFLLLFGSLACNKPEKITKEDTQILAKRLTVEDYYFSARRNGEILRLKQPVFQRGETVFFVLENVGKLRAGKDGVHHVELHMVVENAIGEVVANDENVLGDKGVRNFKGGIIKTPNARYHSKTEDEPGKYLFKLTLIDFVAKDSISVSSKFILE